MEFGLGVLLRRVMQNTVRVVRGKNRIMQEYDSTAAGGYVN